MTILLIEDEQRIASFLVMGLEARGYAVEHVSTGGQALARLRRGAPDLIVLDLALPDFDGLELLRRLRQDQRRDAVIILTARADVHDVVEGLELGADDYVTKPFSFEELAARIRARVRTQRQTPAEEPTVLRVGPISLDAQGRRAMVEGQAVDLSARESALLEMFLRHPGQVLTRDQLLAHVWGPDEEHGSNIIDVYVGYVRRKLGEDYIETVRGLGYRLRAVAREQAG
jgi:DNA-binding response OmpR family regulator